jgi:hypothetical protein
MTLAPGDLIMTGTPERVGPFVRGDVMRESTVSAKSSSPSSKSTASIDVEISFVEMTTAEQIAALKDGRIDVAFGRQHSNITRKVIRQERPLAALPASIRCSRSGGCQTPGASGETVIRLSHATSQLRRTGARLFPRARVNARSRF